MKDDFVSLGIRMLAVAMAIGVAFWCVSGLLAIMVVAVGLSSILSDYIASEIVVLMLSISVALAVGFVFVVPLRMLWAWLDSNNEEEVSE